MTAVLIIIRALPTVLKACKSKQIGILDNTRENHNYSNSIFNINGNVALLRKQISLETHCHPSRFTDMKIQIQQTTIAK